MKLRRIFALITALSLLLMCTGCSLNFFSIESLLAPPALSGKNGEVQEAFIKLMTGKNIQLKTPVKGDYQSSFVLYDLDSDKVEEAFVFYSDSSGDASARMAVLEYVNNTWIIAFDVKGSGSGVYDVAFADLNNDGVSEVFIGWSLFDNNTSRVLSVYEPTKSSTGVLSLITLANEYYNAKCFADLNGNGSKDVILVYLDDSTDVQFSYFRAFSYSGGETIVKFSEITLDSSIVSVNSMKSDTAKIDGGTRLFIDCLKTDTSMITEAVCWNSKTSKAQRVIKDPASNTLRSSRALSQDVDGDGNYEIPVATKLSGTKESLSVTVDKISYNFTLLKWLNVRGDNSEGNIYTLLNPLDSYLFRFTWGDEVTVRYDKYSEELSFCKWDSEKSEIKDKLFSVKFIPDYDSESKTDEDKTLYVYDGGAYLYNITEYGYSFGITDEALVNSFIKL